MPLFSQAGRLLSVSTPLGIDALLLEYVEGTEAISELFEFKLDLLAERDTTVAFDKLLGQSITVTILQDDGNYRYINGLLNRFSQGAKLSGANGSDTFTRFRATIVPRLWMLTKVHRSRIFQQVAIPAILREVFTGLAVDWQLQGTYEPRDYCTQYRETDFAFASRLMEEEGIFYFFKHENGTHTLVVADTPEAHKSVPNSSNLIYETVIGGERNEDRIYEWTKSQEIRSGKTTRWDHCFELPGQHLEATDPTLSTVQVGTVSHKLSVGGNDQLEHYDYPGIYAQRFDGVNPGGGDRSSDIQKIFQDKVRTTKIRMQEETSQAVLITGESTCRQLTPGYTFELDRHFDANGTYVVTRVVHRASLKGVYTSETVEAQGYANQFQCIPVALPYRPEQVTPRAIVHGTQTATVVGPAGEEIFTDKYGRVKVQFHWDREGQKNANSSCWVRVASYWAGKQWGAIHIPRIGQEVVVAFEEGDPDQPIIVGSVYNAEQMPPYTLPDEKTKSGIKSRSTLNGTSDNFNELRFEDKKGEEQIYFHAEKNFDRVVENNDTLKVGFEKKDKGDQSIEIFNNQSTKIGAGKGQAADGSHSVDIFNNMTMVIGSGNGANADGSSTTTIWKNRTVTIKTGDDTLTVEQGKRTTTIKKDDKLTLQEGNLFTKVEKGDISTTVDKGNFSTMISMGSSSTEAMQKIELKVGSNSITIDQTGVTIKGMNVTIEGQALCKISAAMTQVEGSGMLTAKGGIVMIN